MAIQKLVLLLVQVDLKIFRKKILKKNFQKKISEKKFRLFIHIMKFLGFNIAFSSSDDSNVFQENENGLKMSKFINSELSNFGEEGQLDHLMTSYDKAVLNSSFFPHPGQQTFEKMITGVYLPEIFR